MKCKRTSIVADVFKYEPGMGYEDGYENWADVVTKGWIVTDFLVKEEKPDGSVMCPYISHRRGRTFIGEGDYIIIDQDGTKHVCGADKIFTRYEEIDE